MEINKQPLKISVIIPILDEVDNLAMLVSSCKNALKELPHEIILVDDGSTDGSNIKLKELSEQVPNVKVITHERNLGIPNAWWSGFNESSGELICLIDGDLQNPPEYIPQMYNMLISSGFDVVQGCRSSLERSRNYRFFMSKTLNFLLNKRFKQNALDSKSGFLLGYKTVFSEILMPQPNIRFQQNFIGVALRALNVTVIEIETFFADRKSGKSFLQGMASLKASILALADFPKYSKYLKSKFPDNQFLLNYYPDNTKKFGNLKSIRSKIFFTVYFATFPFHTWLISSNTKKYYWALKETEFFDAKKLEEIQLIRLKKLILHAYRTVPYYREIMDKAGFSPHEILSLQDLQKIPLLSKQQVRDNIHFKMFSTAHVKAKMQRITTSGSTGEPFVCYADQNQLEIRFATTLRAYEMAGWRFGDKQTRLWHQKIGMTKSMVFKERLDALLIRRSFVPAFELSLMAMQKLFSKLNRRKPVLIDGYAESFNFLSRFESDIKFSPKAMISSAQQLTDYTRKIIEDKFGCKIIDKYGSREFSGIAYECIEGKNHHVQDESYILEILVENREALPGEIGEVVVTDLNNFSVPLIRYRLGDLAECVKQEICICGRESTQIGKIVGRSQALVHCKNGIWLPGTFFAHFFKDYSHLIKHYQVIQLLESAFTLKLVCTEMLNDVLLEDVIKQLREFTGDTQIDVQIVDSIPLLSTGKRTPVISKLNYDFQRLASTDIEVSNLD